MYIIRIAAMELLPEDINAARQRIAPYVHKTPVFTSSKLSLIGARGAANAVNNKNIKGVVTHSSGNHGQALAFAAKMFGVSCTVVVPENAPKVKVDSILEYNAEIIFCKPTMKDRYVFLVAYLHTKYRYSYNSYNGTIACEFLEQVPQLDALVVPVGGGGMVSGIACWTKFVNPAVKVYCVEPVGKNLANSLKSGSQNCVDPSKLIPTIADGLRVPRLGKHCFSVVRSLSEKTVLSVVCILRTAYKLFNYCHFCL
ncbi:unnamed protein product [Soboliphyme baturini]|uniref:PALP domain-containing protein n=1 Tax=Soboliphyme baturini TaxID=241478 RepID=A0A183IT10_9BILA|nr:unnamed protein product [Soboliphyme baturini]